MIWSLDYRYEKYGMAVYEKRPNQAACSFFKNQAFNKWMMMAFLESWNEDPDNKMQGDIFGY